MLRAIDIYKTFSKHQFGGSYIVLDGCNIHIKAGEILGMMGASGCGKSTFARILLRLLKCDSGKILFHGNDITNISNNGLLDFRRKVQFISQRPESFFDPIMKLEKSFMEPLDIFDIKVSDYEIDEILDLVKLNKNLLDRYPHQLSGGEIQRLSIARALILKPDLLILDEPTSMLDISVQAQILQLLKRIHIEKNMSYLFISHDKDVVNWFCDRVVYMKNRKIVENESCF